MSLETLKRALLDGVGTPVGIYARVSKNDDGTCGSVADQEREIRAFCATRGWIVTAFEWDDGISGERVKNRPGVQRFIRLAETGVFKIAVVWTFDRAGRSMFSLVEVAKRLDDARVAMYSVKEGTSDEVQLALRALYNTIFMKNHRDHLIKGLKGLALKGHNLGKPPVGFRIVKGEPGKVERDPPFDELPSLANSLLLDRGLNGQQIAAELTRQGRRMPSGEAITRVHVVGNKFRYGLLTNPKYVALPEWNRTGRVHSDTHGTKTTLKDPSEVARGSWDVALISQERFDAAQVRLAQLSTGKHSHSPGQRRLLSGLTTCEECERRGEVDMAAKGSGGKMMIRAADTKGRPRLRCNSNYLRSGCPNGRTVYVHEVEGLVLDAFAEKLAEPNFVGEYIEAYNAARKPLIEAYDSERLEVVREMADAERAVQNIVRGVAAGVLTDAEVASQMKLARDRVERAAARGRLLDTSPVALEMQPATLERALRAVETLRGMPAKDLAAPENVGSLDLFRSLIEKIIVKFHPEGRGFALEVHGLIGSLVAPPNSPLALTLLSKSYKKTELRGPLTSAILTILDLKFILTIERAPR